MVSFEAKIGWKRLKKREKRNYRMVTFLTDVLEKIKKKIAKKFKKLKIYHYSIISRQNRFEKA